MNDILLSKMATDMNLFRFSNETEHNFSARVLYSAMSLWMKTIVLDNSEDNVDAVTSVSKKYHTEHSEQILTQFLEFFPELECWFYNNEQADKLDSPIKTLQERLILSEELSESIDNNRLVPVEPKKVQISENYLRCVGLHNGLFSQFNGITSVINKRNIMADYENIKISSIDFAQKYLSGIKYIENEWTAEKEYFNPLIKTETIYKSWQNTAPKQELYISRIQSATQQYLYFIEKYVNKRFISHKIEDFIIDNRYLTRILLYLRYKENNPISITLNKHSDHFEVIRYTRSLPNPEKALLEAIGWPTKSVFDTTIYKYHNYMYNTVKSTFENLLIKINEVDYER